MKYNKRGGFFCKMVKKGRDSLGNRGKGRGLRAKQPFIPFLSTGKQGRGTRASAAVNPAGPSPGVGRRGREKEEGGVGNRSPTTIWAGAQRGSGVVEHGCGQRVGEEGEEEERVRFPDLARAGV